MNKVITSLLVLFVGTLLLGQNPNMNYSLFKQLDEELPTPNVYRNAAGAPGHQYWQQKVDYDIQLKLDDAEQKIYGEEWIHYTNNSPDALEYLWVQLDQNVRAFDSDTKKAQTSSPREKLQFSDLRRSMLEFDGGFKIEEVKDKSGSVEHTVVKTMMRVELDEPLKPGEKYDFYIKWWYNINDRALLGGRSGMEYFEDEDNYIYVIAQFYPRMCMYNDVYGWQNKQFLGRGEFTLEFGDYNVEISVPDDHVVGATGTIQNMDDVLTSQQKKRLKKAKSSFEQPVLIVNQEEAEKAEKNHSKKYKTWKFYAENVRDFAFATSRKFIWDVMAVKQTKDTVLAMSLYPKEGNPLWGQYSTKAVAHTLKWYSNYTFDYPYPVAYSVHTARIGMEYPMICFNYGRPEKDGTYNKRTKYGMISVIIHEVGHNYFPMIVNSDERQWTWMDEGLNTFLQYLTERQWERNYPSRRGPAYKITDYMGGDKSKISPIMTNSESIFQFGNNAYGKPATALNILRETVMGRDLFDYSFKVYSNRWMFKHPTPSDFFRTMEDASGIDLDWFWRAWFYTTDHVDLALTDVKELSIDDKDPNNPENADVDDRRERSIDEQRDNKIKTTYDEQDKTLIDFYSTYDPQAKTASDESSYEAYMAKLDDEEKAMLSLNKKFYNVEIERVGGIPMPVILGLYYEDGSYEKRTWPAEIWKFGASKIRKNLILDKALDRIELDPNLETADVDESNNHYPPKAKISRFELYKSKNLRTNPMQKAKKAK